MKLRNIFSQCIFFVLIFTVSIQAQTSGIKKYHPLSGRFGLSLEAGPTLALSDFSNSDVNFYGRFTGEYLFPSTQIGVWGLKGHAAFGYLEGSGGATVTRPDVEAFRTTWFSLGGGAEYIINISDVVMPYVYAGAAYLYFDPNNPGGEPLLRNSQKKYSKHEWSLIGEGGFKFIVADNVSLNIGFNMNYVNMDNLDDVVIGSDNDIFFTAFGGLTVYLFGVKDSDGDGVADDDDLCPDTPQMVIVDQFGCPVDIDNDGVPDYLDKCPNTPANIPVDIDGCPVDSDGDGVPDYLDLCKDTPEGVNVDKRGCPMDTDGDGVPDYRDNCPDTPIGIEVNRFGCPLESMETTVPEITSMVLSSGVNFEVGKSTLLSGAQSELNEMLEVMLKYPDSNWRISGYTDNTGSYSLNMKLSYDRAQAVADYLIQNGIKRSRLIVSGNGPNYPVADNAAESGRSLNRRVEINLIEDGTETIDIPRTNSEYNFTVERNTGNMIFTDGNLYCIQVSSFRYRSEAENHAQRLRNLGENAFVVEANLPELDGIWYRVRVGYFNSLSEAKDIREKVIK
ncbi:MAG TPA: OmpA family protein [Ignavibacteriaceae bacterium]|nr:OmpA family protein [Ignavibacteriaceae bacterium]